jgi:HEXXH motif-containing protein
MTVDALQDQFESLRGSIEDYRARKVEERLRLVDLIDRNWRSSRTTQLTSKAEWMMLSHIMYEVTEGAKARNRGRVASALTLWDDLPRYPGARVRDSDDRLDTLVGVLSDDLTAASVEAEMPVFALTAPMIYSVEDSWRSLVAAAIECVNTASFGRYLDLALSLVVLLHPRRFGDGRSSWANEAFPCTIFTDFYLDPYLLSKDILHETIHGWLNEAMAARRIELPPTPAYYSPWKGKLRPAYGIIHSGMAFSHVVMLLARLASMDDTPAHVKLYARTRIGDEAQRLREAEPGIRAASAQMRCEELEAILDAAMTEAISQGS